MSRYGSDFKEPPWVIGSSNEVMDWIEATHPSKKSEKDREKKNDRHLLKNLHVQFDFDVKQRRVKPSNTFSKFFLKIIRREIVEEDFDLISKIELIMRALAKAKFRNIGKLIVDRKTLYNHPEEKSDLRKTIDGIGEYSNEIKDGKFVEITAILSEIEECTAIVTIKKIHSKKEHSVDIQFKGEIERELYHTFLNYVDRNLGIKEESSQT